MMVILLCFVSTRTFDPPISMVFLFQIVMLMVDDDDASDINCCFEVDFDPHVN